MELNENIPRINELVSTLYQVIEETEFFISLAQGFNEMFSLTLVNCPRSET